MDSSEVFVKCKVCGNEAKAGTYILSAEHKMMVCPDCAKGKPQVKATPEPAKPAGWDHDDEVLARMPKKKPKPELKDGMKIKCKSCGYEFKFSGRRTCEYCDKEF